MFLVFLNKSFLYTFFLRMFFFVVVDSVDGEHRTELAFNWCILEYVRIVCR